MGKSRRNIWKTIVVLLAFLIMLPLYSDAAWAAPGKNGWVKEDGGYRFYVDGTYLTHTVRKIGTQYYGFGSDGLMQAGCDFDAYSEELKEDGMFRAKADGTLYVNSWYRDGAYYYYYGTAGAAAVGVKQIGGKTYCFVYGGQMITDNIYEQEGTYYVVDENGYATALKDNVWSTVTVNGKRRFYYVQNGTLLRNRVARIGTAYYGFAYDGYMFDNTTFSVYDMKTGNDLWHRAKAGGKLYASEWVQDGSEWYFYKADSSAAEGALTLKGTTYLFDGSGMMMREAYLDGKDCAYYADAAGKVTKVPNNTWTAINGKYYYAVDGRGLRDTVRKIGSAYYGFGYDGAMFDKTAFTAWDDTIANLSNYRAKNGGQLYVNSWYGRYHYGAEGRADQGLQTIGGKKYFFDDKGCAVSDQFKEIDGTLYHADDKGVLTEMTTEGFCYEDADHKNLCYIEGGKALRNAWKESKGHYYYFDSEGYAVHDGIQEIKGKYYLFREDATMVEKGWVEYGGSKHFVLNSGALATGDRQIGDKWYYFDENGNMQTGLVTASGGSYLYGSDGVYIGKAKANGWSQIRGDWYYLSGGEVQTGYQTINGVSYYFAPTGIMKTGCVIDVYGKNKIFGKEGAEVKSGWYQIDGRWYYVDPGTGCIVQDRKYKVGKVNYYFDEIGMMAQTDKVVDGVLYTINASGAITSETKTGDGWNLFGGMYLYYKNGAPFTGWVNKFYVMNGIMLRDAETPDGYYVTKTGTYQSKVGWVKRTNGSTTFETGQYVKKGGRLASDEWLQIGGKWYYFSGHYRVTGVNRISKIWYIFDTNGVYKKQLGNALPEGWVQDGNDWYYFKDDTLINGSLKISGKTYTFWDSRMQAGGFAVSNEYGTSYYTAKSGQVVAQYGWQKIDGHWFYFGVDGRAALFGWIQQGGKQYYIDEAEGMVTGYHVIDGMLYYFANNGVLTTTYNHQNGWKQVGGKWYYFKNGYAVCGDVVTDKGKTYVLDWDGTLASNKAVNYWYADADGQMVRSAWKKIDGVYVYYGADGTKLTGVWKIGGKVYYLDD